VFKEKKRVWDQKKKLYSRLVKGFRLREWGGKKSFSLRERYKNAENVPENYVVLHFEGVVGR
jgi:hypothetical protein